MININEAIQKIKKAGPKNVRVVPAPGAAYNGEHRIEICGPAGPTPPPAAERFSQQDERRREGLAAMIPTLIWR